MPASKNETIISIFGQSFHKLADEEKVPIKQELSFNGTETKKKYSKEEFLNIFNEYKVPDGVVVDIDDGMFEFSNPDNDQDLCEVTMTSDVQDEDSLLKPVPVKKESIEEEETNLTPWPHFLLSVENQSNEDETSPSIPLIKPGRSGRKRVPKTVFDPSDLVPKRRRFSENKDIGFEKMSLTKCKSCEENFHPVERERGSKKVVTCEGCGCKAHLFCVNLSYKNSSQWRCKDCKPCSKCTKSNLRRESLIQCSMCAESFHKKCARVKTVNSALYCSPCRRVFLDTVSSEDSDSCESAISPALGRPLTRRQYTRKKSSPRENEENLKEDDDSVPDCSEWTPEQVYSYFLIFVPSEFAQIIIDQEIDGSCLLLLSRSEVLSIFNLKLGPALKMYSVVKKLQERSLKTVS